jgi:transcriptional regulator with XRE-family HTH domain
MSTETVTPADLPAYTLQRRPEIGQRIRAVRSSNNWTQEQTAIYLGCSRRRVNRVERGLTDFTIFELELLAQVFEVSLTDFLEREVK